MSQEPYRENATLCLAVGVGTEIVGILRDKYVALKMLINNRIQPLGKG